MKKNLWLPCTIFLFFTAIAQGNTSCPLSSSVVRGESLAPLLQDGQKVLTIEPACTSIQKGDFVIFKTAAHKQAAVIKQVSAIHGDILRITEKENVLINGSQLYAPDGSPYQPTLRGLKILHIYEGSIPKNKVMVIGNHATLDSSQIGLLSQHQITGVVHQHNHERY